MVVFGNGWCGVCVGVGPIRMFDQRSELEQVSLCPKAFEIWKVRSQGGKGMLC